MPTRIPWKPFDAANAASMLPRPIQRPAGVALQIIKDYFGGDDPASQVMPNVGTVGVSELSSRGALKEALKIIKDYSADIDPLKIAILQRSTPEKVFHRSPINIPSGFELPKEFGPNYTTRPKSMIDTFLAQKESPLFASKKTLPGQPNAKLTDQQVREIRNKLSSGKSIDELTNEYKITRDTIRNLVHGGGYKWVK